MKNIYEKGADGVDAIESKAAAIEHVKVIRKKSVGIDLILCTTLRKHWNVLLKITSFMYVHGLKLIITMVADG